MLFATFRPIGRGACLPVPGTLFVELCLLEPVNDGGEFGALSGVGIEADQLAFARQRSSRRLMVRLERVAARLFVCRNAWCQRFCRKLDRNLICPVPLCDRSCQKLPKPTGPPCRAPDEPPLTIPVLPST